VKTLLISDNKSDWELIRKLLRAHYKEIQLVCAINKSDAMNCASADGPFGFFILDCNMREVDPDELCLQLLDFTGDRPVIFIGHEAIIKDRISQELFTSNEFNEQILRPLDREDFLMEFREKINNTLRWAKDEEFEQSLEEVNPDDYIKMKIKAFFLYNHFPYDIYLAITPSTYIKIISANKPYSHSTLATYAKKNIKFLHIRKDEQLKYLENETSKCLKALVAMEPSHKDIYLLQLRSITILHQYVLALGITPSVILLTNTIIDSIIKTSAIKQELLSVLSEYPFHYEGIASKSLLTGYISSGIAKKLGWDSETTKGKLAICSLLQDITLPEDSLGKINSAKSPLLKNYKEQEVEEYLNHPIAATQLAQQFTTYSDIDYIVECHHETPNRKGFPNRPSSSKLTQICAVFNTSQYIAAEIDGEELSNTSLSKILKSMSRDYGHGVFKEILKITKKLLKVKD
jgi:CheY-like chemotaxis protein